MSAEIPSSAIQDPAIAHSEALVMDTLMSQNAAERAAAPSVEVNILTQQGEIVPVTMAQINPERTQAMAAKYTRAHELGNSAGQLERTVRDRAEDLMVRKVAQGHLHSMMERAGVKYR